MKRTESEPKERRVETVVEPVDDEPSVLADRDDLKERKKESTKVSLVQGGRNEGERKARLTFVWSKATQKTRSGKRDEGESQLGTDKSSER